MLFVASFVLSQELLFAETKHLRLHEDVLLQVLFHCEDGILCSPVVAELLAAVLSGVRVLARVFVQAMPNL